MYKSSIKQKDIGKSMFKQRVLDSRELAYLLTKSMGKVPLSERLWAKVLLSKRAWGKVPLRWSPLGSHNPAPPVTAPKALEKHL